VCYVARLGDEKCVQDYSRKNLKGRDQLGYLGVDERLPLKWI
jgi:hypothetical protein